MYLQRLKHNVIGQSAAAKETGGKTKTLGLPACVAHAPVNAVGMVTHREDGGAAVERVQLMGEKPAHSAEQETAHPECVLTLATLDHRRYLTCLVTLHIHAAEHRETPQL